MTIFPPLKQKICKQCKTKFTPVRALQRVCGWECSAAFAAKVSDKAGVLIRKAERRGLREAKLKAKSRRDWLKDTQAWFNKFVRLRDAKELCISCGRNHEGQWHAGHYRTVGSMPQLRFDERNCHRQCSACNNFLSGNIVNYRANLIRKIGVEQVDWLEGHHELKHYTIEDLIELKKIYSRRCKILEKEWSASRKNL